MGDYFKEGLKAFKNAINFEKQKAKLKRYNTIQNSVIFFVLMYFLLRVIYYGID